MRLAISRPHSLVSEVLHFSKFIPCSGSYNYSRFVPESKYILFCTHAYVLVPHAYLCVNAQAGKDRNNEADNRAQLLGEQPAELSPQVRSADSIKAAYGHKPTGVRRLACL